MRKTFLFILFFAFIFASQANAQLLLNEILKRMDEHHKALTSLQARVIMEKYNAQLDETDVTEGIVKYLPRLLDKI